jgi:hypothetical protein
MGHPADARRFAAAAFGWPTDPHSKGLSRLRDEGSGHGRGAWVMGWKIINGHRYYYRSVTSRWRQYCGRGEVGALAEQQDVRERALRQLKRREEQRRRAEDAQLDRALDRLAEAACRAAEATLNVAGFHRHHRGEWRKSGKAHH